MTPRNGKPDPTVNVRELVAADKERANDLREAGERLADERQKHTEFVAKLRASHTAELRSSDNLRLAAQRSEDKATALADKKSVLDAVQALAATTESVRLQLEKRQSDTAEALAKAQAESDKSTEIRLSALEKIGFTSAGEKSIADPRLDRMSEVVEKLAASGERRTGGQVSSEKIWAALGVITALLITIGGIIISVILRSTGKG